MRLCNKTILYFITFCLFNLPRFTESLMFASLETSLQRITFSIGQARIDLSGTNEMRLLLQCFVCHVVVLIFNITEASRLIREGNATHFNAYDLSESSEIFIQLLLGCHRIQLADKQSPRVLSRFTVPFFRSH